MFLDITYLTKDSNRGIFMTTTFRSRAARIGNTIKTATVAFTAFTVFSASISKCGEVDAGPVPGYNPTVETPDVVGGSDTPRARTTDIPSRTEDSQSRTEDGGGRNPNTSTCQEKADQTSTYYVIDVNGKNQPVQKGDEVTVDGTTYVVTVDSESKFVILTAESGTLVKDIQATYNDNPNYHAVAVLEAQGSKDVVRGFIDLTVGEETTIVTDTGSFQVSVSGISPNGVPTLSVVALIDGTIFVPTPVDAVEGAAFETVPLSVRTVSGDAKGQSDCKATTATFSFTRKDGGSNQMDVEEGKGTPIPESGIILSNEIAVESGTDPGQGCSKASITNKNKGISATAVLCTSSDGGSGDLKLVMGTQGLVIRLTGVSTVDVNTQ